MVIQAEILLDAMQAGNKEITLKAAAAWQKLKELMARFAGSCLAGLMVAQGRPYSMRAAAVLIRPCFAWPRLCYLSVGCCAAAETIDFLKFARVARSLTKIGGAGRGT